MIAPFVSCITPTYNRAKFIRKVIHSFQSQTYSNLELIIVDNGMDDTHLFIPVDSRITYKKIDGSRKTIGEMRNICCELAKGDIICHFDSDDWSAPERVEDQVSRLQVKNAQLAGYNEMLFFDEQLNECYWWKSSQQSLYLLGTSLCYWKQVWKHQQFMRVMIGEDNKFVQSVLKTYSQAVVYESARSLMVSVIHQSQTSKKNVKMVHYTKVSVEKLPRLFCEIQHYQ